MFIKIFDKAVSQCTVPTENHLDGGGLLFGRGAGCRMIGHRVCLSSYCPFGASLFDCEIPAVVALDFRRPIKLRPDDNRLSAICAAMKVCIPQRVRTPAILLLIELLALADLDPAMRAAAFAPIVIPIR